MTNIVTTDGFDLSALASEMGAKADTKKAGILPVLKNNRRLKDKDKKSLPMGAFYLSGVDGPEAYVTSEAGKPAVKFRPLSHHFQYNHYDADEEKFVSWSRQIANFSEEARSTNGLLRCGKPNGQGMSQLSKEEKAKWRAVKNTRLIRGLVSYEGTTVDGDKIVYNNEPCLVKLTGQNNFASTAKGIYARFDAQFRDIIPHGYEMWNYELDLTSEDHASDDGSIFWYTMEWGFNPKEPLAVTQEIYDSICAVAEMIRTENAEVDALYSKALMDKADMDSPDVQAAMDALGDDLEADFEEA